MLRSLRDYIVIRKSGYFNNVYYLSNYPDVQLKKNPLRQFIECGWKEGKNPSSKFDTQYYLRMYPDVSQAGINPLIHYLSRGRKEGRSPQPAWIEQPQLTQDANKSVKSKKIRNYLYNQAKNLYWSIHPKYRQFILLWVFKNLGFLFSGIPRYEKWRNSRSFTQISARSQHNLIDINNIQPALLSGGKIAIHIHIFYDDLIKEFVNYLKNMPFQYDLYLSVSGEDPAIYERAFTGLPNCQKVTIKHVINRGRDIAPIFCTFGKELGEYDFIAHLHTKKSVYNKGATEGWREYLCNNLLGSEERIRKIFTLLQKEHPYGIVYPQNYIQVPSWANTWLANRTLGETWCARVGIRDIPHSYFDFPASSMFWMRGDALAPLLKAGIVMDDFAEEAGQTDGTFSHCLERMFSLSSQNQGMPPGILKDYKDPSWSAWRFDQYTGRPYESMVQLFNSTNIKLIAFDIFDTLLCRPLLDPETIKRIVSRRVTGEAGKLYLEYRAAAEEQARISIGLDVGLDGIYARLAELTGLSGGQIAELRQIEEEIEEDSLEPRQEVLQLFRDALATGKPVALITDMFLPRVLIERYLNRNDISGWDAIFVSNEIGLRKEKGQLYRHVLTHYSIKPEEMLMIGDNERSDIQIPSDMGASFLHILKPVELARGLPRFSPLITLHEQARNIDAEISLGLVVRKIFSPISFQDFDPDSLVQVSPYDLGYSFVGPFLLSFAHWLQVKSREDGVDRLYFLSREGKLMKQVYDSWSEGEKNAAVSTYLAISRRAAGVAAIRTLDDIFNIARTVYYPNTIENFLYTRYGLRLRDDRLSQIAQAYGWNRTTIVNVQGGKIEHLEPVLQTLQAEIFSQAKTEQQALLRYLADKGLQINDRQAVVDIGYGGSVQAYINKIIREKVHGFYMMTDERSEKVAQTYHVILRGCFHENVSSSSIAPIMFTNAFELEKLLSSGEGQIENYEIDVTGTVKGNFRELLPEEIAVGDIRKPLQKGVMDYVKDARRIRDKMLPDFQPSVWTANMLMEAFFTEQSQREIYLLSKIVLDDYYCGLGLVSQKVTQE